jgi:hypothetical protein
MVKVGFIVEGDTEKQIIKSEMFAKLCSDLGVEMISSVFPPHKKERGKDIFKNADKMTAFTNILYDMGADYIVCLRDLEDLPCITSAKDEIAIADEKISKVIVVKKIEAWFLADIVVMETFFGENYATQFPEVEFPELIEKPDEKLKEISIATRDRRGIGDKLLFAKKLIKYGFDLERAAMHPNCHSANYFINKLNRLGTLDIRR